jgi:hypothetical protein
VLLRNERYRGTCNWNTSEWRKDPDTGKRQRVMRPRDQWVTRQDESLRIVSDELWYSAQRRMDPALPQRRAGGPTWVVQDGQKQLVRKFVLSGILRCHLCGANYTICDSREYACSSNRDGAACSNAVRVPRKHIEDVLLRGPESGFAALLDPAGIERMAKRMQTYYTEQMKARQTRATERPKELQNLTARLERLRARLKAGDPDMTADEIQAAIDRAEAKRRELEAQQPEAKRSAKVLSILPRAAKEFRKQVAMGLDGDPRAALKARVFLREWFGGKIRLEPLPDGGLMAHWSENATALLRGCERVVAGGRFELYSAYPISLTAVSASVAATR